MNNKIKWSPHFLFSRPFQVPLPPALLHTQYFMQYTQQSIDKNSERAGGTARPEDITSDPRLSPQVFPYGAACLDPLQRGMHMTTFVVSSEDTRDSSVVVESQGPDMGKQTSSCAPENETIGPTVRTPIDTTYSMRNGTRFFIHRPTSMILNQMLPLAPIGRPKR